jgi:hypothetical protein
MNRRLVAALAVGVAVGLVAVSGVTAAGPAASGPAATAPATTDAPADGTATDDGTTIDTGNGTLTLEAAPNQTITGESDLAAGTTLTVRLRSSNSATPFLRTADATVADDGTWTATVDLASVADQPTFAATVRHDGERLANASGRVVGEPTDPLTVDTEDLENATVVEIGDGQPPAANASFDPENGTLRPVNATGQRLTGETDLEPGSVLAVRLVSTGSNPFLRTTEAVVTENGTFAATVDLSTIEPDSSFEVIAQYDGHRIGNRSGVVAACSDDCAKPTEAGLADVIAHAPQGERTNLTVTFPEDAEAATLTVGEESVNYRLEALLRDGDDDGRVTVTLDTAAAGDDDRRTVSAVGEDEALIRVEAALAPPLDPANYDLALYRGDDADGEPVDIGTMFVTDAPEDAGGD